MRWAGFEDPDLQVEITSDGFVDRVDFAWRGVRALGESDGYEKYRGDTSDDTVNRVIEEKRREDRLRRACRAFGRWDWAARRSPSRRSPSASMRMGVPRRPRAARARRTLARDPSSRKPRRVDSSAGR